MGDRSGYGQDSLTLYSSILPRPIDITVDVNDPVTGATAEGESVVTPQTPFVLLYKNDPLYGVQYEKALQGTFSLTESEMDVTAVPYYFSTAKKDSGTLAYTWEINGVPINDGINSSTKVFRNAGGVSGTSNISVSVAGTQTVFQTATQSFMINFQKQ
jgi:hypothetical protein